MSTLPAVADRGRSSQILTVIVPAAVAGVPGMRPMKSTGRFLYVVDSPDGIKMRLNGEPFVDARPGTGLECEEGSFFEWFEIQNPNDIEITVTVYVGFARYIDQRVSVIEGPTEATGAAGSLAATSGLALAGTISGVQIRRRAIVVTNLDTALNLELRDGSGNPILTIFPKNNITIPVSGPVELYNPNGSPVQYNVGQIWWTRA